MKLFVLGHARQGKDTVGEMIQTKLGLSFVSSSWFACQKVIWPALKDNYNSIEECFADRSNHRSKWYELICGYNMKDPARLSREIFNEYDMYVGLRNRKELIAARHLSNLVIWVDASERKPPEDTSSMTITRDMADVVVDNNGDLFDLEYRISRLCHTIKYRGMTLKQEYSDV